MCVSDWCVCVCVQLFPPFKHTMYFYMTEGDMGSFIWFFRSPTTLEREKARERDGEEREVWGKRGSGTLRER